MRRFLTSRLSPFRHANYRAFYVVQAISLIGTWSHELARAWLIIELIGTAGALGLMLLASAIPSLILILQGGVLVDRVDVRRLMMITKTILALSALTLASLVEFGNIELWHLLVFAFIEGSVNGFDSPSYQSLTVRLVPRNDFQQALALNSTNFHAARMLGPVVAGLLMAWYGPSLVFLVDALSYIGVIFVLRKVELHHAQRDIGSLPKGKWAALKQGLEYLFKTPSLRYKLVQLLITISIFFPILIVIFRTYIQKKFDLNAEQFGYVFTIPALGSMMGALGFAALKPEKPINALKVGIPCAALLIVLIPSAKSIPMTAALMGFAGFFTYLSFASLTVSLHLEVQEEFRGRLSSIIGMGFISIGPLMSFPIGIFADSVGYETAIYYLSGIFVLLSALLALLHSYGGAVFNFRR